ncbi:putative signal transducing protein [Stenotrophomonas nitritireducens]|uniref:putative signal transducing protein n=1 Tax=Stenotrophomonas nitritireducens TaxID=83617 RepID=UPI003D971DE3
MKLLCSSSSLAFIHSLRIALAGEDIETFCSDAETTSLSSIAGPIGSAGRVYVLHERDWNRAVEIMKELSGPTQERMAAAPNKGPLPIWLVVGVSALLVAALIGMLAG